MKTRPTVVGRGGEIAYSDPSPRIGGGKENEEVRTVDGMRNLNTHLQTLPRNWGREAKGPCCVPLKKKGVARNSRSLYVVRTVGKKNCLRALFFIQ